MNATRATATTTDGAVFGSTTETPPEDPPPEDRRPNQKPDESIGRLFVKFLIALAHAAIVIGHLMNH
jgi:hypothetical protein